MLNQVAVFRPFTIGPSSNRSAALFFRRSSSRSTIGVSFDSNPARRLAGTASSAAPTTSPRAVFFSRCSRVVSARLVGLNSEISGSGTYGKNKGG